MRRIIHELARLVQIEYHDVFIRWLDRQSRRAVHRHRRAMALTRKQQHQFAKHTGALRRLEREQG